MRELIDRILDLSRPQKVLVLGFLILLLLGLDYVFLYSAQSLRIANLSAGVKNRQAQRDIKKKLVANRPNLLAQVQQLDGMLKEAVAQLPDRKEIPDLLSSISTKAIEAGLEIMVFRPKPESPQDFYAEIPVDVVVRGGFHNVVTFFDEVGRLSRLVNMNNIEFKNAKVRNDQMVVEASSLATTFRFLDEAERAKVAAEKAAKAKAGKK